MSILTAQLLEPYQDHNGRLGIIEVHPGSVTRIPSEKWYDRDTYGRDGTEMLEKIGREFRWPLPRDIGAESLPSLPDIHRRLNLYLRKYVWFSDDNSYDLIANWIISTYFREQFRTSPILIFDGVTVAGKSTAMQTLQQVVYRGELMTSGSGAAIAREITDYDSTILLDEILDGLNSDRGGDIYTMIKSCFDRNGLWIRADPKGRSNFKYSTYTSMALSIKGDSLPDDVYNRGIRINMTTMPEGTELADISNSDEDDEWGPTSPAQLRSELYALKIYAAAYSGSPTWEGDKRIVDFRENILQTRQHFTTRVETGQWMYSYVLGMDPAAPQIRDRNRKIASTLYSVGLATHTERAVVEMIIKQDEANKEIAADTPEALIFMALLELVDQRWKEEGPVYKTMTNGLFIVILNGITTTDVAWRYNEILQEQGNASRDPIPTTKVTARLNALGLVYKRGAGNRSYMDAKDPIFLANWMRCLSKYDPRSLGRYRWLIDDQG